MRLVRTLLVLAVLGALGCSHELEAPGSRKPAVVAAALDAAIEAGAGAQRVIVSLHEPPQASTRGAAMQAMRSQRDAMLDEPWLGMTLGRRYRHIPAFSATVTREGLEQLRRDARVAHVQVDHPGSGQLREALPAIGGDRIHAELGLRGAGVRVAVLDTGIDTDHQDLAQAIVAEHCFTQLACPPLRGFESESAEDDHGHGSHVTGVIASKGVIAPLGFAPDVELISVKITDSNNAGFESDWAAGLDWIYDNLDVLDVQVINMSICTNALAATAAQCDAEHPALARAVQNLHEAGVVMFAASGNRGSSTLMSAPACNTGVIAVGATYDSMQGHQPPGAATYAQRWGQSFGDCGDDATDFDQVTCFTNSNARLDLVAPGAPMTSDAPGGQTDIYWGTSQASPVAAAVAALMLECDPSLTPEAIKQAMIDTGVPRMDPKNGLSFPSLRALDAVQAVCGTQDAGAAGEGGTAGAGDAGVAGGAAAAGTAGSAGVAGAAGTAGTAAQGAGVSGATSSAGVPAAGSATAGSAGAAMLPLAGTSASGSNATQAGHPAPVRSAKASSDAGCACRALGAAGHARSARPQALLIALSLLGSLAARRVRKLAWNAAIKRTRAL